MFGFRSDYVYKAQKIINLVDNGFTQSRVNTYINNLFLFRNIYNGNIKSLNIGGNNSKPSGNFQAPSGFVLGSNDGTSVNASEQAFVLVNNYNWSITLGTVTIADNVSDIEIMSIMLGENNEYVDIEFSDDVYDENGEEISVNVIEVINFVEGNSTGIDINDITYL